MIIGPLFTKIETILKIIGPLFTNSNFSDYWAALYVPVESLGFERWPPDRPQQPRSPETQASRTVSEASARPPPIQRSRRELPPKGPESLGIAARGSQRFARPPRVARDPRESSGIGARLNESSGPRVARGPSESSGFAFAPEAPASRRVPRVARGPSESSGPRVARERVVGMPRELPEIRASRRELRARVPRSERVGGNCRARGPSESAGIAAPEVLVASRATAM